MRPVQGAAVRAWRTSTDRHWPRVAGDRRPARAPRAGIAKATASSLGATGSRHGSPCLANIDRAAPAAIRERSADSSGTTATNHQGNDHAGQRGRRDHFKALRLVPGGYCWDGAGRDRLAIGGQLGHYGRESPRPRPRRIARQVRPVQGAAALAWRTSTDRHWPRCTGDRRPARTLPARHHQGHGLARQLARRDQCKAWRFVPGEHR